MTARALLALLVLFPAARVAAQTSTAHLGTGIQAYRDLDMIAASRELRVALSAEGTGGLTADARKQALSYLAAAELYRDRRDSAVAAFRRLVDLDPRYRPDPVVFPPDVVALFGEVQRVTPAVAVSVPARARFGAGDAGLPLVLHANVRHTVLVTAENVLGNVVDTLHQGPVGDSLMLRWGGRNRSRMVSGGMVLGVTSYDTRGRAVRRVELPVQVARGAGVALELPPAPAYLPERQGVAKPIARLTAGLTLAAVSVLVFPEITDSDAAGVATAVLFSTAGVIGFIDARPGKPLPENVAANAISRARWRAQVEAIERANQTRGDGPAVTVEVGDPVVRRSGAPR